MENTVIIAASVAVAALLMWPRLARAKLWRATVTPLASIIRSGFLVLGPILAESYGAWTPLAMALLCALSYAIGMAVRFNITAIDRHGHDLRSVRLEVRATLK